MGAQYRILKIYHVISPTSDARPSLGWVGGGVKRENVFTQQLPFGILACFGLFSCP